MDGWMDGSFPVYFPKIVVAIYPNKKYTKEAPSIHPSIYLYECSDFSSFSLK